MVAGWLTMEKGLRRFKELGALVENKKGTDEVRISHAALPGQRVVMKSTRHDLNAKAVTLLRRLERRAAEAMPVPTRRAMPVQATSPAPIMRAMPAIPEPVPVAEPETEESSDPFPESWIDFTDRFAPAESRALYALERADDRISTCTSCNRVLGRVTSWGTFQCPGCESYVNAARSSLFQLGMPLYVEYAAAFAIVKHGLSSQAVMAATGLPRSLARDATRLMRRELARSHVNTVTALSAHVQTAYRGLPGRQRAVAIVAETAGAGPQAKITKFELRAMRGEGDLPAFVDSRTTKRASIEQHGGAARRILDTLPPWVLRGNLDHRLAAWGAFVQLRDKPERLFRTLLGFETPLSVAAPAKPAAKAKPTVEGPAAPPVVIDTPHPELAAASGEVVKLTPVEVGTLMRKHFFKRGRTSKRMGFRGLPEKFGTSQLSALSLGKFPSGKPYHGSAAEWIIAELEKREGIRIEMVAPPRPAWWPRYLRAVKAAGGAMRAQTTVEDHITSQVAQEIISTGQVPRTEHRRGNLRKFLDRWAPAQPGDAPLE